MKEFKSSLKCPVCKSSECEGIIEYENVPQYQNVNIPNKSDALNSPKGDICIAICRKCGFIFNGLFEENNSTYTENYDNAQYCSQFFKDYLKNIEKNISEFMNPEKKLIMEVGCGQGDLIKIIAEKYECKCLGYDPSYRGEFSMYDGKLTFHKEYFSGECCENYIGKFDIIIFRHVIEHLKNPISIMMLLKKCLKDDGVIYIETPSLDYILENNVIFDFLYEHCSYFNKNSIGNLLNGIDMEIIKFNYSFSDQYMALIVGNKKNNVDIEKNDVEHMIKLMNSFENKKNIKIERIRNKIKTLGENGKVCFWGAGAKGVMCCNLFDTAGKYVDSVVDIKDSKTGNYIPLTGHLIISPYDIKKRNIKYVIVVNPNYFNEVKFLLEVIDKTVEIYDICSLD